MKGTKIISTLETIYSIINTTIRQRGFNKEKIINTLTRTLDDYYSKFDFDTEQDILAAQLILYTKMVIQVYQADAVKSINTKILM
ncbi:MAG: hypothetical protein ACMUEM_06115 [Flavobacteriales bacterium AspAUS03]